MPIGYKHSLESREKIRRALTGKPKSASHVAKIRAFRHTEESKRKVSLSKTGRKLGPHSAEHRRKIGESQKGKIIPPEQRKKISESRKNLSEETHRKMSEAKRNISEETRKKYSDYAKNRTEAHSHKISIGLRGKKLKESTKIKIGIASRRLWKDELFQKKMRSVRNIRPNKLEIKFNDLLESLFPNEYQYVGDFKLWIDGKNPDFVNINGKKKLIELYGDYWHRDDNTQDRIDHFAKYGFETLIVWQSEFKDVDVLKNKLTKFHEQEK